MRRWFLLSFLLGTLHAQTLDPTLLSSEQQKNLALEKDALSLQNDILRDSWINPINTSFSGSFKNQFDTDQASYTASITIDQPVFKSGGIYFGINYANALRHYQDLGIKLEEKRLIQEVITHILTLRKLDLEIQKAELTRLEAQEALAFYSSLFNAGEISTTELISAKVALKRAKLAKLALQKSHNDALYLFTTLSSKEYKSIKLPTFTLIKEDAFLHNNLELASQQSNYVQKSYASLVTLSSYLPTLNARASYNYTLSLNQVVAQGRSFGDNESLYFSYGFLLSMPLAFNSVRDVQKAHVDAMRAKITLSQTQKNQRAFYLKSVKNVELLKQKATLLKESATLYEEILTQRRSELLAGEIDQVTLNKVETEYQHYRIDYAITQIESQIELLQLYAKLYNEAS